MLWVGLPGLCLCADGSVKLHCVHSKQAKGHATQHGAASCCATRKSTADRPRGNGLAALKVKGCCSAYGVAAVTQQKTAPQGEQLSAVTATVECPLPLISTSSQAAGLFAGDSPPPLDLVIQHRALRI
jgi:hypothetical protein